MLTTNTYYLHTLLMLRKHLHTLDYAHLTKRSHILLCTHKNQCCLEISSEDYISKAWCLFFYIRTVHLTIMQRFSVCLFFPYTYISALLKGMLPSAPYLLMRAWDLLLQDQCSLKHSRSLKVAHDMFFLGEWVMTACPVADDCYAFLRWRDLEAILLYVIDCTQSPLDTQRFRWLDCVVCGSKHLAFLLH